MRRFLYIIVCLFSVALQATEYRLQFFDDRNGLSHWHTSLVVQDSTAEETSKANTIVTAGDRVKKFLRLLLP